ncbi:MerR family transcriptional regulator [Methylobacterium oryzihabitans]|uniref:MerR family DNA-binding transcriptional regulator n=1 Tax=Methylobacterium oryzihabitans TaxID=2499852 RepID=A0A3S2XQ92_9HYPH|nr:MerR family DNA-binding transcriptional regulator [Methylobacterium oryzihabitans]RVU20311.1 MerR family DNA-binding transcriptional regulator [Methylobacterium oryzihabitans]
MTYNRIDSSNPTSNRAGRGRAVPARSTAPATLTIGDLAEEFGVTLRALRFYEAKGLLRPQRRGTTRLYTEDDRTRLATILRGKELGFTLREIAAMVDGEDVGAEGATKLALSPEQVAEQIAHLESQKADIEKALVALRSYGKALPSA